LHGYRPLRSSINPVSVANQLSGIRQLHLAGEKDSNIPPWLIGRALGANNLAPEVLPGVTHAEGWDTYWPQTIARLRGFGVRPACSEG
jgi:hypothetical protein